MDTYTCISCGYTSEDVECSGIYYCPNPICTISGAAGFRSKTKGYVELYNGKHRVDPAEMARFGIWLLKGDLPNNFKNAVRKSFHYWNSFLAQEKLEFLLL